MSLLDKWNAEVVLYPEETIEDVDGNIRTRASKTPIPLKVWLSILNQSGTAARRAEQDNEGFETEQVLRMRLRRQDSHIQIGAQSKVVWEGNTWSVFGDRIPYMGSPRTKHFTHTLRRA